MKDLEHLFSCPVVIKLAKRIGRNIDIEGFETGRASVILSGKSYMILKLKNSR